MSSVYFRARTPEVTFDDFKTEILIIDLKTGHYHSLRQSAAQIWRLLNAGEGVDRCIERLASAYGVSAGELEADTRQFVAELETMQLIVATEAGGEPAEVPAPEITGPYEKPVIESYGDLQDLLLLDPIHEIAPEAGWPHRREDA